MKSGNAMLEDLGDSKPADTIAQLCQLPFLSQALYAVAKLGVADLLADGPKTDDELAQETNAHAPSLYRVLRALCGLGLLEEVRPHRFALTSRGACLRTDAPDSQRAYVIWYCHPASWQAAMYLLHTVQTGQNSWERASGMDVFQHLRAEPELAALFNAAMSDGMRQRQRAILSYDFSGIHLLVDVGGNQGRLLASVLQANPALKGVLFDRPEVVARAPEYLQTAGVDDRCEVVGGDFFQTVPTGGDAYLVSNVIHDWEGEPAVRILQNCRRAITAGGSLLLVERVLPEVNELSLPVLSDLVMLAIGGRERTQAEYRTLLSEAGFELQAVIPSDSPYCLLKAGAG